MAVVYLSAEGLQKLKDELVYLEGVERPRVIAAIQEARDKGDLSENAEYGIGFSKAVSADLQDIFPDLHSFSVTSLKYMRYFYKLYLKKRGGHQ